MISYEAFVTFHGAVAAFLLSTAWFVHIRRGSMWRPVLGLAMVASWAVALWAVFA